MDSNNSCNILHQIFVTYWSQATLILGVAAYLIKRLLDQKSKKLEINHSLFQQNRIKAVTNFLNAYSQAEHMWNQLPYSKIISRKINVQEVDEMIWPYLRNLRTALAELQIYFETPTYAQFNDLADGHVAINGLLLKLSFDNNERTLIQKTNEFYAFQVKKLTELKTTLDTACKNIRDIYKAY